MGNYARILLFTFIIMSMTLTACVIEQVPPAEVSASPTAQEAAVADTPTDTPTAESTTATATEELPTNTSTVAPATATTEPTTETPPTATSTLVPATPTPAATPTPVPATATPTSAPATATLAPAATPTPDDSNALERFGEGLGLLDAEKWPEAIAAFQEVIASEPDFAPAYQGLGFAYLGNKELEKAVAPLEKYLELASDAEDRAQIEELLTNLREFLASPLANIDFPAGKGALVIQNCRGGTDTLDIDVIPVGIFVQLPPRTPESCSRSDPIFLDPGEYQLRASIAGRPSQGDGGVTIAVGEASEFTWY